MDTSQLYSIFSSSLYFSLLLFDRINLIYSLAVVVVIVVVVAITIINLLLLLLLLHLCMHICFVVSVSGFLFGLMLKILILTPCVMKNVLPHALQHLHHVVFLLLVENAKTIK